MGSGPRSVRWCRCPTGSHSEDGDGWLGEGCSVWRWSLEVRALGAERNSECPSRSFSCNSVGVCRLCACLITLTLVFGWRRTPSGGGYSALRHPNCSQAPSFCRRPGLSVDEVVCCFGHTTRRATPACAMACRQGAGAAVGCCCRWRDIG